MSDGNLCKIEAAFFTNSCWGIGMNFCTIHGLVAPAPQRAITWTPKPTSGPQAGVERVLHDRNGLHARPGLTAQVSTQRLFADSHAQRELGLAHHPALANRGIEFRLQRVSELPQFPVWSVEVSHVDLRPVGETTIGDGPLGRGHLGEELRFDMCHVPGGTRPNWSFKGDFQVGDKTRLRPNETTGKSRQRALRKAQPGGQISLAGGPTRVHELVHHRVQVIAQFSGDSVDGVVDAGGGEVYPVGVPGGGRLTFSRQFGMVSAYEGRTPFLRIARGCRMGQLADRYAWADKVST